MNEENNNFDISFENENNSQDTISEEIVVPGNLIGEDDIVGNNDANEDIDIQGPIIVSTSDSDESDEITGPIVVNSQKDEEKAINKINNDELTMTFKELEDEIKNLSNEKNEIEQKIQELSKRNDELSILIKSKQEELDYKKEVEVTTDKLKTYIKDLEVKPGAVRDALAALINNMDN